jgi:hypothetical protein
MSIPRSGPARLPGVITARFPALAQADVGIAPAPIVSVGFALNAGPSRPGTGGRCRPRRARSPRPLTAAYRLIMVGGAPSNYCTGMFPGLVTMGVSGGLSRAPMFAAAGDVTCLPDGDPISGVQAKPGRT